MDEKADQYLAELLKALKDPDQNELVEVPEDIESDEAFLAWVRSPSEQK